jgi:REP-associated tyrosine transposase
VSRPRRIDGFSYRGPNRYFLTCCTRTRIRAFVHADVVSETTEEIRRTCRDELFELLAYCFMPDHLHLLVAGSSDSSDLRRFVKISKQRSGALYALKHGGPLWQEGYHDRVLRAEDDTKVIARYILANPVRAGLVDNPSDYAFSGSDRWTIEELLEGVS